MRKKHLKNWMFFLKRTSSGQGLTEYGSVLAFIAIIIAFTLHFAPGRLGPAVTGAFSAVTSQISHLTNSAQASGS